MPPSLASRLLFHAAPAPVLFDTPNVSTELTLEIFDFIALALRAYVSPWWSKITRYDKDFLPHITLVLTHVIRAIDRRIHALDVPDLVFHDISTIITQHYRDYRNAAAKTSTAYASGGAAPLSTLFAHLQPHMAISPQGVINREYYRQIVDHILKLSLPPEEYGPEAERLIIREVIVKVLIDDVIPRIVEPWFIHRTILDLMGPQHEPLYVSQPNPPSTSTSHTFIVMILSFLQSFSGMCLAFIHAYKHAISTIKLVQQSPPRSPQPPPKVLSAPPAPPPPEPIIRDSSITSARSTTSSVSSVSSNTYPPITTTTTPTTPSRPEQQSYAEPPLILLSEMISAQDRFTSTLTLTMTSMIATSMTPFLDKLLPYMLHNFLSPVFILNTTRTAKRTLFPNGYPGPQPPTPSPEEQAEWRARLVSWRGKGGVAVLLPLLLGPDPSRTLGMALDPLSDAQCNLRLCVFLLDRILLGLFPELAGSS